MKRQKLQTFEIAFLDDPETVHTVPVPASAMVRARHYEIAKRPKGESGIDWQLRGLYGQYLAAQREKLPHSELDFDDWCDMVAVLVDDDEAGEEPGEAETSAPPS